MKKKCAICSHTDHHCIRYKESFICEECLGYICGLEPIVHDGNKTQPPKK